MGSTTAVVIGMTWGGVEYAWTSAPVLAPLIIGGVGLLLFLLYEALWARHPLVRDLGSSRLYRANWVGRCP